MKVFEIYIRHIYSFKNSFSEFSEFCSVYILKIKTAILEKYTAPENTLYDTIIDGLPSQLHQDPMLSSTVNDFFEKNPYEKNLLKVINVEQ